MADTPQWTVEVDGGRCIGSAMCTGIAPHAFQLIDGRSHPVNHHTPPDQEVLDAAELCPVEAVFIGRRLTKPPEG
ncbi:ferredoxin [Phytomonospora sp. NPDC050363]|uniref:ferredoxin n=1 Tax=Phytomonospora sp. NPDC050363 TaxID=3155642 RepID=UPI0033FE95E4